MPEEHPLPPIDFSTRELPVHEFDDRLWRISQKKYVNALYFGASGDCRFDAPDKTFGTCYLACDLHGAFIEGFGHSPGFNLVTQDALADRTVIEVLPTRPLVLVDITAAGLAKLGADSRLSGGGDYDISQAWSAAIYAHPANVDGILYRSRHDPSRICCAAFERCRDEFEVDTQIGLADERFRSDLISVIDHYEFALG